MDELMPYLMTKRGQFTCPVVCGGTSFNADQTWGQRLKAIGDFAPSQLAAQSNLSISANAMPLQPVLGQITTNNRSAWRAAPLMCRPTETAEAASARYFLA